MKLQDINLIKTIFYPNSKISIMKNYLTFMIVSLFMVSCYQDDDVQFHNDANVGGQDGHFYEERTTSNDSIQYQYQTPDLGADSSDDPPPKQVGGNGAKPAPNNGKNLK